MSHGRIVLVGGSALIAPVVRRHEVGDLDLESRDPRVQASLGGDGDSRRPRNGAAVLQPYSLGVAGDRVTEEPAGQDRLRSDVGTDGVIAEVDKLWAGCEGKNE